MNQVFEPQAAASLASILMAEDDPDDVFLLRRALKRAGLGHRLIHVTDGELAINYLAGKPPYSDRNANPVPDLLLLDVKMPKMSGHDVLAWLKTRPDLDALPVVMLSSSAREEDIQRARQLGADDYPSRLSSTSW